MPKLIIATDAWYPQVNGVVKCVEQIKNQLEKKGFEVIIIHPGMFFSIGLFFYPEIRLSVFPKSKIRKIIEKEKPDFIHIVTEGPIGIGTRSLCLKNKWKFTTANHTNFQIYINKYLHLKTDILTNVVYAYLRKFHNAGNGIMVITPEIKSNFENLGFKNVLLWPLGVDIDEFKKTKIFLKNILILKSRYLSISAGLPEKKTWRNFWIWICRAVNLLSVTGL